jgi:DNA methylase
MMKTHSPHLPGFSPQVSAFTAELAAFREFGAATACGEFAGVPVFENEFWTAKQREGHSLQEVSYRACFKPSLPGFFIRRFTKPGDCVYDPFMGRGTTLIEAALLGRRAVGNDVNPLSIVLAAPRLAPPAQAEIEKRVREIPLDAAAAAPEDLHVFYHPDTLREIAALRAWFIGRRKSGAFDAVDAWLQMVATNRLTGHSVGYFSVYTLPPNQATSVASQRKINAKRNQTPPRRDVRAILLKKSRNLLKDPLPEAPMLPGSLHTGSAASTPGIAGGSVALIVTSPPFLDIVQYKTDNWLRAWFCGIELDGVGVWEFRKIEDWSAAMRGAFAEFRRVLRPGGLMAFEVGEVRKGTVRLEEEVVRIGRATGFTPECVLINTQDFTKTSNCWGITNNKAGTNSNRIVVLRKPE